MICRKLLSGKRKQQIVKAKPTSHLSTSHLDSKTVQKLSSGPQKVRTWTKILDQCQIVNWSKSDPARQGAQTRFVSSARDAVNLNGVLVFLWKILKSLVSIAIAIKILHNYKQNYNFSKADIRRCTPCSLFHFNRC